MKVLYVIERTIPSQHSEPSYIAAAITCDGAKSIMKEQDINEDTYRISPICVPFYGKYLRYAFMYRGYHVTADGKDVDCFSVSKLVHTLSEAEKTSVWKAVAKEVKDNPGKYRKAKSGQIMPTHDFPPFPVSEGKMVASIERVRIYKI